MIEQPQSATFLLALRLMFLGLPVVLLSLALFFALRFPLTPQLHHRLRAVLEKQRAGQPVDEAEKRQLSALLLGER
ncbi:MAG: hypothetical protein N3B68_10750 [Anaerolineae bacterium]|nr:hypothetical protein [Anaerolineae bacterium]